MSYQLPYQQQFQQPSYGGQGVEGSMNPGYPQPMQYATPMQPIGLTPIQPMYGANIAPQQYGNTAVYANSSQPQTQANVAPQKQSDKEDDTGTTCCLCICCMATCAAAYALIVGGD